MIQHSNLTDKELWKQIHQRNICFAGNNKLKIYGTLGCVSGKKMKRENRVFFRSEKEALHCSFRPCAHCMKDNYKQWKNELIRARSNS